MQLDYLIEHAYKKKGAVAWEQFEISQVLRLLLYHCSSKQHKSLCHTDVGCRIGMDL